MTQVEGGDILMLIYENKDSEKNIFTSKYLNRIKRLESLITNSPRWSLQPR